ncbi:MAG: hypothetical protein LKKZDAJK_002968 [Candidatus Fervidibacter sp.]|mgnify:CR=1 FL=1
MSMRWMMVALGLFCQVAFGQGLISVPTGDVLEQGTLSVDAELDTGNRWRSPENLVLTTWRYGMTKWLTIGADVRLTRKVTAMPNFSVRLLRSSHWAMAYGVENVGVRSFGEQPYLTLSYASGRGRWHLGWTNDERDEGMTGMEWRLSRRLTLQSDFITGTGNFFALGFQYSLSESASLSIAYLRPNDRRNERGIFVDFNFSLAVIRH